MGTAVAQAQEVKAGNLTIENPWARATVPAAKVGGGYVTISNSGPDADRLISASVDPSVAAKTEIHQMKMDGDVMSMRAVTDGLEIPAGGKLELQPDDGGGYHIMFMELAQPLTQGETFSAKLTFEKAGEVSVDFSVGGMGENPDAHQGHGG
jgi:copper(I)-binding protein